jgi:putative membrane protein
VLTLARAATGLGNSLRIDRLAGSLGRYEGLAFMAGGIALIAVATTRFARTTALIDDPKMHPASSIRTELIVSATLIVLIASYSIYLAFD